VEQALRPVSRQRLVLWICGGLSLLLWIFLAWMTRGLPEGWVAAWVSWAPNWMDPSIQEMRNGFWYPLDNNSMPTVAFLVLQTLLWGILCAVLWLVLRFRIRGHTTWIILGFGLLFRLVLCGSIPIHENDFYRYLWDGKVLASGVNPYLYEPAALYYYEMGVASPGSEERALSEADADRLSRLAALRDANPVVYERIGHSQVPTVYPPVAQVLFLTSHLFFGDSILGLRLLLILLDLGCLAMILALLRVLKRPAGLSVVYAWSPLVLVEIINSLHYDVLPVFCLLLGIYLALQRRAVGAMWGLICSGLSKFFGLFLLPVMFPPSEKASYARYAACAGVMLLGFLPFILWQGTGIEGVTAGLRAYTERWQNNGGAFLVLQQVVQFFQPDAGLLPAKAIAGLGFLAALLWLTWRPAQGAEALLRKCFAVVALFFVISPTAFPWYFVWVLPFVSLFPSASWLVLMQLLSLYYLQFHDEYGLASLRWLGIPLVNWLIWLPFAIIWAIQYWPRRLHALNPGSR